MLINWPAKRAREKASDRIDIPQHNCVVLMQRRLRSKFPRARSRTGMAFEDWPAALQAILAPHVQSPDWAASTLFTFERLECWPWNVR